MSRSLVTIVTPTFNRPSMFSECAQAVLDQTFRDWVWWIVVNSWEFPDGYTDIWSTTSDYSQRDLWDDPRVMLLWYPVNEPARHQTHVPAQIINWLYPKVTTPYIYFLADDDLIDPAGLGVLAEAMEAKREHLKTPSYFRGTWEPTIAAPEAVYGRCEVVDEQPDGSFRVSSWCYPHENLEADGKWDIGLGTGVEPSCRIDGGQVLHTKALWNEATRLRRCEDCEGSGRRLDLGGVHRGPEGRDLGRYVEQTSCALCSGTGETRWQLSDSKDDAAACDGLLLNRMAQFARFHYVPQRIVTHRRHAGAAFHRPQGAK